MADLRLVKLSEVSTDNPVAGDLWLDPITGQPELVTGDAAVIQDINARLEFALGEWFLDLDQGVPYHEEFLVDDASKSRMEAIIGEVISGTPGVATVDGVSVAYRNDLRLVQFDDIAVTLISGAVLTAADFGPLIIGGA